MNKKENHQVILVDINNTATGTMDKLEAHKQGKLHRAISVFICNSKGSWLLQRRDLNKYHSAGLWSNACCTHPYPGEQAYEAANRRLLEEMGIRTNLTELFDFIYKAHMENGLTEHEFDQVFYGQTDDLPNIDLAEVMEWRYISFSDLEREIEMNPDQFTVWFRKVYNQVSRQISAYHPK